MIEALEASSGHSAWKKQGRAEHTKKRLDMASMKDECRKQKTPQGDYPPTAAVNTLWTEGASSYSSTQAYAI